MIPNHVLLGWIKHQAEGDWLVVGEIPIKVLCTQAFILLWDCSVLHIITYITCRSYRCNHKFWYSCRMFQVFLQKLSYHWSNLRPKGVDEWITAPLKLNCWRYICNRIIANRQPKLFFNVLVASRYSINIPCIVRWISMDLQSFITHKYSRGAPIEQPRTRPANAEGVFLPPQHRDLDGHGRTEPGTKAP